MPESAAIAAEATATAGAGAAGAAAGAGAATAGVGAAGAAAAGAAATAGVAGALSAGGSATSAAAALYGAMKKPPAPTQMPSLQNPTGEAAAAAIARRAAGSTGLSSTNLTGPQGLTAPATTAAKTLLGG